MKQQLVLIFFLLAFPLFGNAQNDLAKLLVRYNTGDVPFISVEQLMMKKMHQDSLVILDAREPEEYAVSHLQDATFSGYNTFSEAAIEQEILDKSTPIVVYCSIGIRSGKIAEKLKKAGYTQVENLYGGIFEWKNKDYPVIDSTGNTTERVHAYSKSWGKWLKRGEKVYSLAPTIK